MQTLSRPCEIEIFNDGVMTATEANDWLFLYWVTHDRGRLSKQLIRNIRDMEDLIKRGRQYRGWVCNSERNHAQMHKIIERLGAKKFHEEPDLIFFKKEINHV